MDWNNHDVKKYLGRGERVLFSRRIDSRMLVFRKNFSSIFLGVFTTFFISFFVFITLGLCGELDNDLVFRGVLSKIFLFAIPSVIMLTVLFRVMFYLHGKSCHFVLTSRGIYSISGLLVKSVKFVSYNRITDVDVYRGLLALKFDTLTIGVSTASGDAQQVELSIIDIPDYDVVLKYIMGKIK